METLMRKEKTKTGDNGASAEVRVVASTEIMDRLERIANGMLDLSGRISNQLAPICNPVLSAAPGEAKDERTYPEFFKNLNNRMVSIETSMQLIHDVLNSCEI